MVTVSTNRGIVHIDDRPHGPQASEHTRSLADSLSVSRAKSMARDELTGETAPDSLSVSHAKSMARDDSRDIGLSL